jgi:pimeloyl-ACP methyl ester carboxylesterase
MSAPSHHFVETNGIRMHYVEAGKGPLVVLCHGFPESWYSWRHQIAALAEAGFRVVAPDQRGYGQTDLLATFYSLSGDAAPNERWRYAFGRDEKFLDTVVVPRKLPSWLSEGDLDFFTGELKRTGFRGGLNWYRNIDRAWELTGFLDGARLGQPTLFVAGERDAVVEFYADAYQTLEINAPNLTKKVLFPGAGHWIQQERPAEVNRLLIEFLRSV